MFFRPTSLSFKRAGWQIVSTSDKVTVAGRSSSFSFLPVVFVFTLFIFPLISSSRLLIAKLTGLGKRLRCCSHPTLVVDKGGAHLDADVHGTTGCRVYWFLGVTVQPRGSSLSRGSLSSLVYQSFLFFQSIYLDYTLDTLYTLYILNIVNRKFSREKRLFLSFLYGLY